MRQSRLAFALAAAFPFVPAVHAQSASEAPVKELGVVTINGGQATSLPTQIPTTMEGVTREQLERTTNATDSEDALKYLPSLRVRKRYIGDYNHAVLSSRASGTGNCRRCPAASSSAPTSPACWCISPAVKPGTVPACCCWTSRRPVSTCATRSIWWTRPSAVPATAPP